MSALTHQQQPTHNSCMVTCVSMATGRPVKDVMDLWHEAFHCKTAWLDDAMDYYGIPYLYGNPRQRTLPGGFFYFLTVASLNIQGGLHQILVLVSHGGDVEVYDPVMGREGARYYVWGEPGTPSEVSLISWGVDLILPLKQGGDDAA